MDFNQKLILKNLIVEKSILINFRPISVTFPELFLVLIATYFCTTLLTHGHLFTSSPRPMCLHCPDTPISILHILSDCPSTLQLPKKALQHFHTATLLKDTDSSVLALFQFLSDAQLLSKI